ncbi:DUF3949 domain-containing protein [Neobacillus massiliamazoniensis]|uniref:Group-specific protein n=1 Tax=Neobacillus massiliamazoniensis TaxID=1499688 RepID=A0A0U1P306_9BACI|nr:DUF3949 domain-containing protein [Neobacillus massiliamazoniensis]CRK84522.1 group-specific protein [Neobacillus massiliamazoniensis]
MDLVTIVIVSVLVLFFLIMIPVQYSYISEMKERREKAKLSQNDLYDRMSFEEQELHYSVQGSFLTLPSNLVAMIIYKIRHRKNIS